MPAGSLVVDSVHVPSTTNHITQLYKIFIPPLKYILTVTNIHWTQSPVFTPDDRLKWKSLTSFWSFPRQPPDRSMGRGNGHPWPNNPG